MLSIHPNSRTTPAVHAEIARSAERTDVLARRYGVSTETIRKWRRRGPEDCLDRSARPHKLPWKASEEERAVVGALRRAIDRSAINPSAQRRPSLTAEGLPARRPHLRGPSFPAPSRPGQRLPHPQGGRAQPPAAGRRRNGLPRRSARSRNTSLASSMWTSGTCPSTRGVDPVPQGTGPRRRAGRAADRRRLGPQALPVCGHGPALALGAPGRQGRRDRGQRGGLPQRGASRLPVQGHLPPDRPRQLLHRGRLREGLPRAGRGASQEQALLAGLG